MLNVTDNGVKITLETNAQANPFLILIMGTALLLFAVGVALALGWLSVRASIGALALIAVFSYIWRHFKQKSETLTITGGQVLLSNRTIEHHGLTGKKIYRIDTTDRIDIGNDSLIVKNAQNKIRFVVTGFPQSQHIAISQAVLQGKQIQAQGKAIRMQNQ